MTPEAQRIAIAEVCGLKFSSYEYQTAWPEIKKYRAGGWYKGDEFVGGLPDYLNDLNAMHEAEKVLMTDEQREQYWIHLVPICDPTDDCGANSRWICAHATAAQRAEAFLRTLELWK